MGFTAQRLYDLVARALEEPPQHRRAWIEGACGGNDKLRDEVLRVVGADEGLKEFLATPAPARFDALAAPGPPLPPGATVGRYHLKRVLGSGGSGAVYEALQESPQRKVALKVMAAGLGSTGAMNRFREEAEILARMSHPGVAHVYEAGVHREGATRLPWLAIEYVEGRDIVAHAAALDVRARLALMARVCDAVHHGHEQGILHGDVKPTNILVDALGTPKVIDFGIARALGVDTELEIAGTPPYMSPEQCQGARLDVRSDVYSLGAVLYELLAGRRVRDVSGLPLAGALRAVLEEAPVPLDRVNPRLKGDVAAIVGKALARDREKRYASAAALADDLRRHLGRRPVEARPHGVLYVAATFARREPTLALALAAVVLLSVGAALVGTRLAWQKEREREAAERQAYVASLAAASAALRAHDVGEARQQLARAPEPLRGWEWRHLEGRLDDSVRTIALPGRTVMIGALSADGTRAAVIYGGEAQTPGVTMVDVASGREIWTAAALRSVYSVAVDAGGARVAVGGIDGWVEIRDGLTGAVRLLLEGHDGMVNGLAFDPRGRLLATAGRDRTVRLWDPESGKTLATLEGHEDRVISVAFDARGERVASGGREGTVRVFEVATGKPLLRLTGHEGSVEGVAWSPDGRRIASVSRDRMVRLWDATAGTAIAVRHGHENNVRGVAFAPDGRTFASASWDRTVRLWSGEDGHAVSCLHGHETSVMAVAFAPAGSVVVTFGGQIKVWRPEQREEVPVLYGHRDVVRSVEFAEGGRVLASASRDATVRLWDIALRREIVSLEAPSRRVDCVRFLGGGSTLAVLCEGKLRLWKLGGDGLPEGGLPRDLTAYGLCMPESARTGRIAIGYQGGHMGDLDPGTGKLGPVRKSLGAMMSAAAFDPSGHALAAGTLEGEVALLDAETLVPLRSARPHAGLVRAVAYSPDGATIASASADGRLLLLDARTLAVRASLEGHIGQVYSLAFHPDGTRLATGGEDATVRLWDPRSGEALLVLHGPRYAVWSVAWSPDGRCLASAEGTSEGADSCIRLWAAPLAPSK